MYTHSEDDLREIRKEMSGLQNWKGKIRGDEFAFFINITLPADLFAKFSLLRTGESETQYHARKITKYLFSESDRKMSECNSILNAHESIIDFMMGSMANRIPNGEEKGISIGDISFVGYSERLLSITFARNNIMAVVLSVGESDLDVRPFAKKVDEFLLSKNIV